MATFEGYERRIKQINEVLETYGIESLEEAKRICDFLNGVTFALNGKVEKIAKLVYMFTPNN